MACKLPTYPCFHRLLTSGFPIYIIKTSCCKPSVAAHSMLHQRSSMEDHTEAQRWDTEYQNCDKGKTPYHDVSLIIYIGMSLTHLSYSFFNFYLTVDYGPFTKWRIGFVFSFFDGIISLATPQWVSANTVRIPLLLCLPTVFGSFEVKNWTELFAHFLFS